MSGLWFCPGVTSYRQIESSNTDLSCSLKTSFDLNLYCLISTWPELSVTDIVTLLSEADGAHSAAQCHIDIY